jgi:SAM-dependent methyltransferase
MNGSADVAIYALPENWGYHRPLSTIFWVSVLGLFLELLLIRWISTEIRIFAYLQNTILVVCFLGLGAGLFTARRPVLPLHSIGSVAALVLLLTLPVTREALTSISELLGVLGEATLWYAAVARGPVDVIGRTVAGLILTLLVMWLLAEAFMPLGRLLGRLLDRHSRPILAYSVNVAGSLLGTWLFVGLSTLEQPPAVWFVALGALFLPIFYARKPAPRGEMALLATVIALSWLGGRGQGDEVLWSPYQKLVLRDGQAEVADYPSERYLLDVNNVGYQQMSDLRPEVLERTPSFPPSRVGFTQYDLPFHFHPSPSSVLLVGAGTGNDAAGALRAGVENVTAVEIDPAIIRLGRRLHPERPYNSPRVRVVNDDARSFFATTDERYDVIVFGLLDSHTTTSMTNTRLDHYVYTREALERARALLNEGGILFLSFAIQKPFIADRMAGMLKDVFGEEPVVFPVPTHPLAWGGDAFVVGDGETVREQLAANPQLLQLVDRWQGRLPYGITYATPAITDDWPYLYLPSRQIPILYVLLAGLLAVLVVRLRGRLGETAALDPRSWSSNGWHFFFLGAAFLLLEVQNISKAAVVLGSTWEVNAVIISGVLIMVLCANGIVAASRRLPVKPIYGVLLLTALGLYFVDLARFAHLPYAIKALLVGGLTTLPMLFSGMVFARSFTLAARKDHALGANLIGAMVGAVLQSVSFIGGVRLLLLLVAGLYALAMLTRPRISEAAVTAPAPSADPGRSPPGHLAPAGPR